MCKPPFEQPRPHLTNNNTVQSASLIQDGQYINEQKKKRAADKTILYERNISVGLPEKLSKHNYL